MRKLVAIVALGAVLIASSPVAAHANPVALGLAAFAAFTTLVTLPFVAAAAAFPYYGYPYYAYPRPVYYSAPPAYYAPPPTSYSTPPASYYSAPPTGYYSAPPVSYATPPVASTPAVQREVVYPNGRHVLYGDGVNTPYQWAWVPNAPVAPPSTATLASSSIPLPPAGPPPPPPPLR